MGDFMSGNKTVPLFQTGWYGMFTKCLPVIGGHSFLMALFLSGGITLFTTGELIEKR